MDSTRPKSSPVVDRGTRIYDQQLRAVLEPEHIGKYVVINVDTGEYELDREHMVASDRAAKRWPNSPRYATRVGFRTLCRIGGGITVIRG